MARPPSRPRVALLTFGAHFYSTRRLIEVAREVGAVASIIDPLRVSLLCPPRRDSRGQLSPVAEDERVVARPDVVVPRVGARLASWGQAILRAYEAAGVPCPIGADALARAADKLCTSQLLAGAGLPVVPTVAVREPHHVLDALALAGSAPIVVKRPMGTQGRSVALARTAAEARGLLDFAVGDGEVALVQPFFGVDGGADLRILVLDGEVLAAVRREPAPGDFRSNVHRGGRASEPASPSVGACDLAVAAARTLGLAFAGVDMLRDEAGRWHLLEVNGSPGLEGAEAATGRDLARPVMAFFVDAARAAGARRP